MNFQHFPENNLCFHIAYIICSYVNTNQVSSFFMEHQSTLMLQQNCNMRFMLWHIDMLMLMLMSQIVFYLLHGALVLSLYIDVVFTFFRRCLPHYYTHIHTGTLIDPHLTSVSVQIPITWWRHQIETFSALLAICAGNSPVPGEFPTQRPVTRSFDVFFDVRPNKQLSKQSWGWWFETLSPSLWRHRNDITCH